MKLILLLILTMVTPLLSAQSVMRYEVNSKWGFKDDKGAVLIEPVYDSIDSLDNGYYLVKSYLGVGVVNPAGKEILEPRFSDIEFLVNKANNRAYISAISDMTSYHFDMDGNPN